MSYNISFFHNSGSIIWHKGKKLNVNHTILFQIYCKLHSEHSAIFSVQMYVKLGDY